MWGKNDVVAKSLFQNLNKSREEVHAASFYQHVALIRPITCWSSCRYTVVACASIFLALFTWWNILVWVSLLHGRYVFVHPVSLCLESEFLSEFQYYLIN